MAGERGKVQTGPELTVDDLESSTRFQGKNLLELAKSPKMQPLEDTFTLSQSAGTSVAASQLQASSSDPQSSSVISILKKKPPASPSLSSQNLSEKRVNFVKDQQPAPIDSPVSVPSPVSVLTGAKAEALVVPATERLHKECPCCTCHLKESSLRTQSFLQSIPERQETDSDLQSMAYLSSVPPEDPTDSSKASLQFLSKLKSHFIDPEAPKLSPVTSYSPTERFIPLSMRAENSPSRIFRSRLNQRLMKHVGSFEEFRIPDAAEAYQTALAPQLKLTSIRSKSSSSLMSLSLLP